MTPSPLARGAGAGIAMLAIVVLALAAAPPPAPPGVPAGVARDGDTPLRSLVAEAAAVVVARPGEPVPYDEGRLLVHPLRIDAVWRGTLAADTAPVVEIRGTSARPPLFGAAERVVVLLRPAAALTYYAAHLPDGPRFEPVGGRAGVIPIRSETDLDTTRSLLEQGSAAAALPAGEEQQAALRALAFAAVAARHPRWLADALLELRAVPAGAELTTDEVSTLAGALRDTTLPAPLRVRLLGLLAERRWVGAADVLASAEVDDPSVLDALFEARARLGLAAGLDELRPHLRSRDPRVRAAAVRALAAASEPEALAELGRIATHDADEEVQTTAVEALGSTGKDEAIPFVKRTFDAGAPAVRQASARALLALGGRRKNDALLDLALRGATPEARHYAAVILMISTPADDPAIARLRAEAQDPQVQRLFEHGLELKADRHDH